ncbi:MAG: CTP synthetase [Planktotalea sp.]|uniref:CTP synthetase n=1 Tax=Planktotalea sp. TaxID=2029877 RepID=UPI003C74DAC5
MTRLAGMLFSLIATTLAGSFIVAALTMGYDTLQPLLIAAAIGGLVALPVTYFVAKAIVDNN